MLAGSACAFVGRSRENALPISISAVAAGCAAGTETAAGKRQQGGASSCAPDIGPIINRYAPFPVNRKPDAVTRIDGSGFPVHAYAGVIKAESAVLGAPG